MQISSEGRVNLNRVELESDRVTPVTAGERVVYGFSVDRAGSRAALAVTDPLLPNDLFAIDLGGTAAPRRLTDVNRAWLERFRLSRPERRLAYSPDGTPVEYWVLPPSGAAEVEAEPQSAGRQPGRLPAVLQVHGGPQVMFAQLFFFEFHLLASQGLVVVYGNPRGSMGYGQAFTAAIRGHWGSLDFMDVMAILDAAEQSGRFDPAAVGIAGGSYGGFMVNWAVGHTDRFAAAVTMRSISFPGDLAPAGRPQHVLQNRQSVHQRRHDALRPPLRGRYGGSVGRGCRHAHLLQGAGDGAGQSERGLHAPDQQHQQGDSGPGLHHHLRRLAGGEHVVTHRGQGLRVQLGQAGEPLRGGDNPKLGTKAAGHLQSVPGLADQAADGAGGGLPPMHGPNGGDVPVRCGGHRPDWGSFGHWIMHGQTASFLVRMV